MAFLGSYLLLMVHRLVKDTSEVIDYIFGIEKCKGYEFSIWKQARRQFTSLYQRGVNSDIVTVNIIFVLYVSEYLNILFMSGTTKSYLKTNKIHMNS